MNECCYQTQQNDKGQSAKSKQYWNIVVFFVVVIKLNITAIHNRPCVLGNDAFVGIFPVKAPEIGLLQRLSPTNTDQGVKPGGNWIVNLSLVERLGC